MRQIAAIAALLMTLVACSSKTATTAGEDVGGESVVVTSGNFSVAAGGRVVSEDTKFAVLIVGGELTANARIDVRQGVTSSHSPSTIGRAYEVVVSPANAVPANGFTASLVFKIAAADLPIGGATGIAVGRTEEVGDPIANLLKGTYTGDLYTVSTSKFSTFMALDEILFQACSCNTSYSCSSSCGCDPDCDRPDGYQYTGDDDGPIDGGDEGGGDIDWGDYDYGDSDYGDYDYGDYDGPDTCSRDSDCASSCCRNDYCFEGDVCPPAGWTCSLTWYDDGGCDCGCGALDSTGDCDTGPGCAAASCNGAALGCEYCFNDSICPAD
jgi:hypothetical protein